MKKLIYRDDKIFENERMTYKLDGKYNVLCPSGKLVARFKIKNLFSLRGKKQAVIGNLKIEKMKDEPISEAKIINRQMKLINHENEISLIKDDEFLGSYDFENNTIEVSEDEGLVVSVFFALKKLEENR
ncbi:MULTISPECIES: hypothetical protein [Anaerococcus]|uniref:hypothetical protein n=1 Tax=Anaerococcus TaxID=165779 RepID=UPI0002EEA26C|nr:MULTISPECIES: hypothetical protein [Anaerococcus]MDU1315658.1 hypothetical protein [Anaerococcus hydrogenalis]